MNDDIKFLKELQNELNTQDHDCQAAPRFWTIEDYEWFVAEEGYHDKIVFFSANDCEEYSVEEVIEKIKKHGFDDVERVNDAIYDYEYIGDTYEIESLIKEIDSSIHINYVVERQVVKENTMFLTKEEAKRHLNSNKHHYSSKAHTYAMTAWRAPKVERLFKILETFDWDSIDK